MQLIGRPRHPTQYIRSRQAHNPEQIAFEFATGEAMIFRAAQIVIVGLQIRHPAGIFTLKNRAHGGFDVFFSREAQGYACCQSAKELEENIAFQNKSRKDGGRNAKRVANVNAIWKQDKPGSRKRTSSTAEVPSAPAKKARETQDDAGQYFFLGQSPECADKRFSDDDGPERAPEPVAVKSKGKARKYAAPIDIESDSEPEAPATAPSRPVPRLDLSNLPPKAPAAVSSKAKASEATTGKTNASKAVKLKPAAAKIIAESHSESEDESLETASSDSEANEQNSTGEESEGDNGPIDDREFLSEHPLHLQRPQMFLLVMIPTATPQIGPCPRKATKKTSHSKLKPQALFASDSDEDAVDVHVPSKKTASKKSARATSVHSASDDSMPDAPPARVTIPPLTRHSRRSSMASSYSSGQDLSVPPSELESELGSEPDIEVAPPKKKKSKKVSASRQKKADAEKPEIVQPSVAPNVSKGKAPVTTATRPESSWDISARISLPAPNKDIGLTAQPAQLQAVLRAAMHEIKLAMLFTESYPVISSRAGFARPYLIQVARSIGQPAAHVLQRLLTDAEFTVILAPIPLDRMNLLRGRMKRCAVSCILAFFQLADLQPEQVKARVEELLKDHRYIFLTNPATGGLLMDQPFRHGAIRFVLKEEVFTNASFVAQNLDRFPATSSKRPGERELPDAMVALTATAVYAALVEYRMTGHKVSIPFTEDVYEDIYRNHISTLEQVRKNAPVSLHKVLHGLFVDVTQNNGPVHTASGSSATLIHLVDLPESD
ncbi:hypothetical protein B0H12DRAFT_1231947 [Mycena haematopus]|nr:hypothetical protein B0H12DRAFT_1231947 [Mycena haematopus]